MLLHNHPSGLLEPSDADLSRRRAVARWRHRLRDHRQRCDRSLRRRRSAEGASHRADRRRATSANALGPDGPIAALLARYEDRPAQREMASAIATLYNDGGIALLEAGTGVGKSLGYLLPALALGGRERRAHGRLDEHDQSAGAARRQGSSVSARRAHRSAGAIRTAQGMAQLSLSAIDSSRRRARPPDCSPTVRPTGSRRFARGPSAREDGSLADLAVPPQGGAVG